MFGLVSSVLTRPPRWSPAGSVYELCAFIPVCMSLFCRLKPEEWCGGKVSLSASVRTEVPLSVSAHSQVTLKLSVGLRFRCSDGHTTVDALDKPALALLMIKTSANDRIESVWQLEHLHLSELRTEQSWEEWWIKGGSATGIHTDTEMWERVYLQICALLMDGLTLVWRGMEKLDLWINTLSFS